MPAIHVRIPSKARLLVVSSHSSTHRSPYPNPPTSYSMDTPHRTSPDPLPPKIRSRLCTKAFSISIQLHRPPTQQAQVFGTTRAPPGLSSPFSTDIHWCQRVVTKISCYYYIHIWQVSTLWAQVPNGSKIPVTTLLHACN